MVIDARNSLARGATGCSPAQLALNVLPRHGPFLTNDDGEDYSTFLSDGVGYEQEEMRQQLLMRSVAAKKWVQHQTVAALDRSLASKPMAHRLFKRGGIVFFHRFSVGGRRKNSEAGTARDPKSGRWVGPARVVGTDGQSVAYVTYGA
eukprot:13996517-Alexandrium_andersonii.AAC.1